MADSPDTGSQDNHFNNDGLTKDLKKKSLHGGAIIIASNMVKTLVQLAGTAVLARILMPEDFGLVAMVLVVTGFFNMFRDSGLTVATVQCEHIAHDQSSAIFWAIGTISLTVMFVVMLLSPAIVWLYDEKRLLHITLALAFSIFLGGLGLQHRAILRRQMRFGRIAGIELIAVTLSLIVGIGMALSGFSYWAIVGIHASRPVFSTLLLWLGCSWRPGKFKRNTGLRSKLVFGGYLSVSNLIVYLARSVDQMLIGIVSGGVMLGLYTKAISLMMLPVRQLGLPVSNIALPVLSRMQNDPPRYRHNMKVALLLLASLGLPLVSFAFIAAREIILLFLGDNWLAAVPLLQAMLPAAFMMMFRGVIGWALVPLGKSQELMKITLAENILLVAAFLIGINWNTFGVAIAMSIHAVTIKPLVLLYSFRQSIFGAGDFFRAVYRPVISSIFAGMVTYQFHDVIHTGYLVSMLMKLFIFFILYLAIWRVLPGGERAWKRVCSYVKIIVPGNT